MGGYDQLVYDLYEAGLDSSKWSRVGAALCQLVGADMFFVWTRAADGRPLSSLIAHELGESAFQDYAEYYWRRNPLTPRMMGAPDDAVARLLEVCPYGVLERSEVFQDWAIPNGVVETAAWRGRAGHADDILAVSVTRNIASAFGTDELALLTSLAPHISQAVRLQTSLARARIDGTQLGTLGDAAQLATFLLAPGRNLLEANGVARSMLQHGHVLRYVSGRIEAVDPTVDRRLAQTIESWACGRAVSPIGLGPAGGGSMAFLFACGVADAEAYGRSCLLVVVPSSGSLSAVESLGLSPRLRQVLELLLQGRSDKDVADALKLTHASARTYVTRLYAQLKVHGRNELWQRYGAGASPEIAPASPALTCETLQAVVTAESGHAARAEASNRGTRDRSIA